MGSKDCPIPEAIKHLKVWELFFLYHVAVVHVVARQRPPQSNSVGLALVTGACECSRSRLAHEGKIVKSFQPQAPRQGMFRPSLPALASHGAKIDILEVDR